MTKFSVPDRIGAACGAAYIVLINVGNTLTSGASEDPHPTGAKDLADFSAAPTFKENLGFGLEVLGFVAFMFFVGWLVTALRDRGGSWSWLSSVAGIGGVITLAVKLGSAAPILTGEIDHHDLTPALARVLADMNGSAFVVTFLPYGVFMVGAAGALLAAGWVGKVLGWSGLVIGAAGVVMPLATHMDPVNSNVLPFLFGMLWTLGASVRLAWKGPRTVDSVTSAEPLAVPA